MAVVFCFFVRPVFINTSGFCDFFTAHQPEKWVDFLMEASRTKRSSCGSAPFEFLRFSRLYTEISVSRLSWWFCFCFGRNTTTDYFGKSRPRRFAVCRAGARFPVRYWQCSSACCEQTCTRTALWLSPTVFLYTEERRKAASELAKNHINNLKRKGNENLVV